MKKILFSIIALFIFGLIHAQSSTKFGLRTGLNFSNLTGDLSKSSTKLGFNIGAFAQFNLSNKFAIQPEVLYSGQGASYAESSTVASSYTYTTGTIYLDYILVPIMAKYQFVDGFNFEFGPQIGFIVASKNNGDDLVTTGDVIADYPFNRNIKDRTKSIDFGLNFGVSYDLSNHAFVGIRYNFGLDNVIQNQDGSDFNSRNSVLSLNFGYKF